MPGSGAEGGEPCPRRRFFRAFTQDVTGEKGQKLSGIGMRAILFKATDPSRIYVETKTGFADIATSGQGQPVPHCASLCSLAKGELRSAT